MPRHIEPVGHVLHIEGEGAGAVLFVFFPKKAEVGTVVIGQAQGVFISRFKNGGIGLLRPQLVNQRFPKTAPRMDAQVHAKRPCLPTFKCFLPIFSSDKIGCPFTVEPGGDELAGADFFFRVEQAGVDFGIPAVGKWS